jgi:transposase
MPLERFCLKFGDWQFHPHLRGMTWNHLPLNLEGLEITSAARMPGNWLVEADLTGVEAACPECGSPSTTRHSRYVRTLNDLPVQGARVCIRVRAARWRCQNTQCSQTIFVQRLPGVAAPHARRTRRMTEIVTLLGHSAGGRPGERLMARLGMPVSDDTLLRQLKRAARVGHPAEPLRVVGVDDWAWRKGHRFGTIFVDLERRTVADLLPDRSSSSVADWFRGHRDIEFVARDRHGLYAEGARSGAPQARQVADRFHLIANFRETAERQLSRLGRPIRRLGRRASRPRTTSGHQEAAARAGRREAMQVLFSRVRNLYDAGGTAAEIMRTMKLGRARVQKWIRLDALPERNPMTPKSCTPAFFHPHLFRRWNHGCSSGRQLFAEIKQLGYTGSYAHLSRYLAHWRDRVTSVRPEAPQPRRQELPADPATGRSISPLIAAMLCIKPRSLLTARQAGCVEALKAASPDFATMRALAMRFRGLLRSASKEKLGRWLEDARLSGIYGMQRFAQTLRQDIAAVENAATQIWSSGQVEGQINRLKTLKRAMYGRPSTELLRARMLPLSEIELHQV